jgi:hypothetical protein
LQLIQPNSSLKSAANPRSSMKRFDPSWPSHHEDEMLLLDTNTDVRIIRRGGFL